MEVSEDLRARLIVPAVFLAVVVLGAAVGYYVLGGGRWSYSDCLYMTSITLTTVGFGEVLPGMEDVPGARAFTVGVIILGMGSMLVVASNLTAVIIEGDLRRAWRKTRMRKEIKALTEHVVVCGVGSTGRHVMEELIAADRPCVAIDIDRERLEQVAEHYPAGAFRYIVGDATDDEVLAEANVASASGMVAALANDKDNLFLVVTTRQANPKARIIARGSDLGVLEKLKKSGADAGVSPNFIGGMRMVSEMLRPHVVKFLDEMLRDRDRNMRIEEIAVPAESRLAGNTIGEANIRRDDEVGVLAVKLPGGAYHYNPGADFVLRPGAVLVVLGSMAQVNKLRAHIAR